MKASVKLRDGESPLVRAKLPLSILGFPIVSGASIGSSRELALHVGTLFEIGPCCRFTYRPNNPENPLSLLIKTGFGSWGNPAGAPLVMSAELRFSDSCKPSFAVHLKPKFGNFSAKKTTFVENMKNSHKIWNDPVESPKKLNDKDDTCVSPRTPKRSNTFEEDEGKKSPVSSEGSSVVLVDREEEQMKIEKAISFAVNLDADQLVKKTSVQTGNGYLDHAGWSLIAHTALPLGRHAVANVRWRVNMSADMLSCFHKSDTFSLKNLPVLVVDKLSLESCEDRGTNLSSVHSPSSVLSHETEVGNPELAKVRTMCASMKRQLHLLQVENKVLKRTMEDMKKELGKDRSSVGINEDWINTNPSVNPNVAYGNILGESTDKAMESLEIKGFDNER